MKKKQLLALLVDPLVTEVNYPDVTKQKVKTSYGKGYVQTTNHYTYRAFWDQSTGEKVLIVDIFTSGTKAHVYRQFTGVDGFFGYNYREQRISSAGMDFVLGGVFGYRNQYNPADAETEEKIKELTGERVARSTGYYVAGNNAISLLGRYHGKMKEDKLQRKYQEIKDSISREMIEIREMPKTVESWVNNTLMKNSRYILYQYNGKRQTTGYCTHCHTEVTVKKPKKGEKGNCPNCHSKVTFLPRKQWEKTRGFNDEKNFCWFQSTKKGYCIRYYKATKRYWPRSKLPGTLDLFEYERIFYEKEIGDYFEPVSMYDWGEFRQTGTYCFNRSYSNYNTSRVTNICPIGLNKILRTNLIKRKYIDFAEIVKKCGEIDSRHISDFPVGFPQVEYLIKLKLYHLAAGIINGRNMDGVIDTTENNIKKALGIGKDDIPVLQKINPDFKTMKLYKSLKQREGKVDVQTLKWLTEVIREDSALLYALRIVPATVRKIARYLKEQEPFFEERWGRSAVEEALSFWKDYLRDCVTLQRNLKDSFVLFPKDLQQAHNVAMEAVKEQINQKDSNLIEGMEERLNRDYYFEDKSFFIRAPHNVKEIQNEGDALHHCVGRYTTVMAKGKTIILFVRKREEPDKPYYTVELNPINLQIMQYRGYGNNVSKEHPVDPEVTKFLKIWKEKKLNQLKVLSA